MSVGPYVDPNSWMDAVDIAKIEKMTLAELEQLTSKRAEEKGFSLSQTMDPEVLTFPANMAFVFLELMESLETHRKGKGIDFASSDLQAAYTGAIDKISMKFDPRTLSPEKKYLITKILLVASECAEAIEAVLDLETDSPKTSQTLVAEELADVVIRAVGLKAELDQAVAGKNSVAVATAEKIVYNAGRPKMHGSKLY